MDSNSASFTISTDNGFLILLGLAVVFNLLVFIGMMIARFFIRRRTEPDTATPIYNEPPADLTPAEIGAIFDYKIDSSEFYATIL